MVRVAEAALVGGDGIDSSASSPPCRAIRTIPISTRRSAHRGRRIAPRADRAARVEPRAMCVERRRRRRNRLARRFRIHAPRVELRGILCTDRAQPRHRSRVHSTTRCCFGPSYALIRAEFRPAISVAAFGGSRRHAWSSPSAALTRTIEEARVARILPRRRRRSRSTSSPDQAHPIPPWSMRVRTGVTIEWRTPGRRDGREFSRCRPRRLRRRQHLLGARALGVPALDAVVADNQQRVAAAIMYDAGMRSTRPRVVRLRADQVARRARDVRSICAVTATPPARR